MYYSFKCTYCGRVFYTYDTNRENASRTLYHAIKKHLIEYDEDHKEYEMDDGEQADSDQIYEEMSETKEPPAGGYEALSSDSNEVVDGSTGTYSSSNDFSKLFLIILALLFLGFLLLFIFVDVFRQFILQSLPANPFSKVN